MIERMIQLYRDLRVQLKRKEKLQIELEKEMTPLHRGWSAKVENPQNVCAALPEANHRTYYRDGSG